MEKTVIELFAGVGGFRVGLNNIEKIDNNGHAIEKNIFNFVWSNQYEPQTIAQHAFDCYNLRFNESLNSNVDIALVNKEKIPDHTLLCGGFPCQDYSVAHSLSKEKGIQGKKGVLWWQIRDILEIKHPPFVLLENVDRLLQSPSTQRGRDFGIMLKCFDQLNYNVEYRIINAADYGMPQRRRRTYIFAYSKNTKYAMKTNLTGERIINNDGIFAKQFPINSTSSKINKIKLNGKESFSTFSDTFSFRFENAGCLKDGIIYTTKVEPMIVPPIPLKDIIENDVDIHYFLNEKQIEKIKYLRSSKKIPRTSNNGVTYIYSEGAMSEFDDLSLPARTMLTSEGTINRCSHIIKDLNNQKLRFLTPKECERINQFPDNWTNTDMPEKRRYFIMGNALVCGVIKKIGIELEKIIKEE